MSIGQSIVIKGHISAYEDLVIAGRVEGSITLDGRVLTLAPSSHVDGQVAAGTVIVSGRIAGRLDASERLEIRSSAVVQGEVVTPVLVVVEGSQLDARVAMPRLADRASGA